MIWGGTVSSKILVISAIFLVYGRFSVLKFFLSFDISCCSAACEVLYFMMFASVNVKF